MQENEENILVESEAQSPSLSLFIILSSVSLPLLLLMSLHWPFQLPLFSPHASFQSLHSSIPHSNTVSHLPLPSNILFSQINLFASFTFSFLCVSVSDSLLHEANLVSTKCTMFH